MKKTYIEPKNTVVALRVRDNVMQIGSPTPPASSNDATETGGPGGEGENYSDGYARKSISTWDEW